MVSHLISVQSNHRFGCKDDVQWGHGQMSLLGNFPSLALYIKKCVSDIPAVPAMSCCSALLLLACCSLLSSHPDFWTTSRTSSPGSGGRISNLERSRLAGENMEGNDQPKENNTAIPTVTKIYLLPKFNCRHRFNLKCPDWASKRRSLLKKKLTESLYARFRHAIVKQAVLQALGGKYMAG